MVNLPPDILILKSIKTPKGEKGLAPLPLSEIPNNQARVINSSIRFIQQARQEGHPNAGGFYSYELNGKERITYRIVGRGSWGAENP